MAAGLLALVALVALAGCTRQEFPQSTLHPQADYAWGVQRLLEGIMVWVIVIFVLVEGALILAVIRFRDRPGLPEPKRVHGHTGLEIGWTVAPAVVLAFIAVPTVLTIFKTQSKAPPGALEVKVVGHQWWWEFQYPELGVTTAGELHVPVGRPISLALETADVIHSFWFPSMGGKRDVVPSHTNRMWFTADSVGTFPGQCAELCGVSHANMRMMLFVETPERFGAWVAAQKAPPVEPDSASLAGRGKAEFTAGVCITCHTVDGVSAGVLGPNLTHFGSRTTFAGAIFPNDTDHLGHWIQAPQDHKPGVIMNWKTLSVSLSPEQVSALVAYMQSLK